VLTSLGLSVPAGMTADGNHGGASDAETTAALFLYSKAGVCDATALGTTAGMAEPVTVQQVCVAAHRVVHMLAPLPSLPGTACVRRLPLTMAGGHCADSQLASWRADPIQQPRRSHSWPTLPQHRCELGVYRVSSSPHVDSRGCSCADDASPGAAARAYLRGLLLNAAQVQRYLRAYRSSVGGGGGTDGGAALQQLRGDLDRAVDAASRCVGRSDECDAATVTAAATLLTDFLRRGLDACRRSWTTFGDAAMAAGTAALIVAAAATAAAVVAAAGAARASLRTTTVPAGSTVVTGTGADAACDAARGPHTVHRGCAWLQGAPLMSLGGAVVTVLRLAALLSNSYIDAEPAIVGYLAASLAVVRHRCASLLAGEWRALIARARVCVLVFIAAVWCVYMCVCVRCALLFRVAAPDTASAPCWRRCPRCRCAPSGVSRRRSRRVGVATAAHGVLRAHCGFVSRAAADPMCPSSWMYMCACVTAPCLAVWRVRVRVSVQVTRCWPRLLWLSL
jgi:hypothetical protein